MTCGYDGIPQICWLFIVSQASGVGATTNNNEKNCGYLKGEIAASFSLNILK